MAGGDAGLKRRRAESGEYQGAFPPFGYHRVQEIVEGKAHSRLVIDPHESEVVLRIYREYISGRAQLQIARSLNEDGIKPQRADAWSQTQIAAILRNPVYIGKVTNNGDVFDGNHKAIVEVELWEKVRQLRGAQARTTGHGKGRRPGGRHLFIRGQLVCGECGSSMTPVTKPNRSGGTYEVYQCLGRIKKGPEFCSRTPIKREQIDVAVYERFERTALDVEASIEGLAERIQAELAGIAAQRTEAELEVQRAEDRIARVRRAMQDGHLDAADYAEQRAELDEELDAAKQMLDQVATRDREVNSTLLRRDAEAEILRRMSELRKAIAGEIVSAADIDAARAAVQRLFTQCILRPEGETADLLNQTPVPAGCDPPASPEALHPADGVDPEMTIGFDDDGGSQVRKQPLDIVGEKALPIRRAERCQR